MTLNDKKTFVCRLYVCMNTQLNVAYDVVYGMFCNW